MPQLSRYQREQCIGRLGAGWSTQIVANAYNVNVRIIYQLQLRYNTTNSTNNRPRSGRQHTTTFRANICKTQQLRRPIGADTVSRRLSMSSSRSYRNDCNVPQLVNFGAISNGEKSSCHLKVGSVFRRRMAEYRSGKKVVNVTQMNVSWRETRGVGKASLFEEPSDSIIKLDLLSFRILAQVEVMASRFYGISFKSFDFTLCPILAVTSITCSNRSMPTPTLPEPPGTFSSSTI